MVIACAGTLDASKSILGLLRWHDLSRWFFVDEEAWRVYRRQKTPSRGPFSQIRRVPMRSRLVRTAGVTAAVLSGLLLLPTRAAAADDATVKGVVAQVNELRSRIHFKRPFHSPTHGLVQIEDFLLVDRNTSIVVDGRPA
jgi:hypothetical protein